MWDGSGIVVQDASRPTLADLLAAWNGPDNAGVREAVRPPHHHSDGTLSLAPHEPEVS